MIANILDKNNIDARPNKKSTKLNNKKLSKSKNLSNSGSIEELKLLTSKVKKAFNYLK